MDEDEDDVPTCPLCLEELDATDRAVKACQCGYQVCLWCLHHIREQHTARCPACRTPYEEQNFKFAEVNPEEAAKEAKERATAKKERERREKLKEIEKERARAVAVSQQKAKNNLKHARILQRNLVYVIGLSLTLAREEVMRRADMFGKFGRMLRILINRSHPFNADAPGGPSISAYVQYYRDSDALAAVRTMNNAVLDGREIRCSIATTKYCDVFVKSATSSDPTAAHHCGNQHCMYYHSISPEPTLTREEVLARQLGPPPPAHLFVMELRHPHLSPGNFQRPALPASAPLTASNPSSSTTSIRVSSPVHNRPILNRPLPVGPASVSMPHTNLNQVMHPASSAFSTSTQSISGSTNATPANGTAFQHPLFSSPRLRSTSIPAPGRKPATSPPFASPSASPDGTPPGSPRPQRPTQRLHRSPIPLASGTTPAATIDDMGTGNGASGTTVSSSFHSPSVSTPSLPSTAGWASPRLVRSTSRSPPNTSPSASMDDLGRSRPRIQIRRPRENAPPGFEDSSLSNVPSVPSRPPGFDNPVSNAVKRSPGKVEVSRPTALSSVTMGSPPPGFGPGPSSPRSVSNEQSGLTDVAVAWAQEASTDEVFSANERRTTRPVGQSGQRLAPGPHGDIDSRSELAQVLAKIGGDLGVSSEFYNVSVPSTVPGLSNELTRPPGITADKRTPPSGLGSLFGTHSFQTASLSSGSTNSALKAQQKTQAPRPSVCAPFTSPFGRGAGGFHPPEVVPARRNNSRFGFARQDSPPQTASSVAASMPISQPPSVSTVEAGLSKFRIPSKAAAQSSSPGGMQTESHILGELTRNMEKPRTTATTVPPVQRQSRSRFDFADRSSPPKSQPRNSTASNNSVVQPVVATETDPVTDAFGAVFANLSTEEKLASIFSSAQWSADKLPPMPVSGAEAEPVPNHPPDPLGSELGKRAVENSSTNVSLGTATNSLPGNDKTKGTSSPTPSRAQFAPPGFKEATPDIPPESTAVDKKSTTSGVAANVVSGGVLSENGDRGISGQTDEAQSSGTESFEEDRKRSKAQRKREKKAGKTKDSADTKTESWSPKATAVAMSSEVVTTKVDDRSESALGTEFQENKRPTPSQNVMKPRESPKQLRPIKLSDDPGRFMSVSELEREVEAARVREAQLQDKLQELQRRIRSYDNVRT